MRRWDIPKLLTLGFDNVFANSIESIKNDNNTNNNYYKKNSITKSSKTQSNRNGPYLEIS